MKKYLLILTLFLLTGCTNIKKQTEVLSDSIVSLIYDCNYDYSSLNNENKRILNEFLEKEKFDNKVINISNLDLFAEEGRDTTMGTTNGVYKENDEYFIKYSDLNFITKEYINDSIAYLYVDGYAISLLKDEYPIIQTDTCGNVNYRYRYMKREKEKNNMIYYYKSFGNGSMLKIIYKLNGNKIEDIDLIFNKYYVD